MGIRRITALYGALLAAVFLWLSIRVAFVRWRRDEYVGESQMVRHVRVHANFSENVPIALLRMVFIEVMGATSLLMYGLG